MKFPRKVRTTIRPDETIEVDESEYTDLSRQGLIVDQNAPVVPESGTTVTGAKEGK